MTCRGYLCIFCKTLLAKPQIYQAVTQAYIRFWAVPKAYMSSQLCTQPKQSSLVSFRNNIAIYLLILWNDSHRQMFSEAVGGLLMRVAASPSNDRRKAPHTQDQILPSPARQKSYLEVQVSKPQKLRAVFLINPSKSHCMLIQSTPCPTSIS